MNEYLREYEFEDQSVPSVKVCQSPDFQFGFGSTVWDAALVLCAFLESPTGKDMIAGKACIELGAGTGIVSIAASVLGAGKSVATDIETCVPFIRQNIGLNVHSVNCSALGLDWTSDKSSVRDVSFDWILCADCVYEPSSVTALIDTIETIAPAKGIVVSNERRDTPENARAEKLFIEAMYKAGYTGKAVHRDVLREEWRCDDIDVVVFEKSSPELDIVKGA